MHGPLATLSAKLETTRAKQTLYRSCHRKKEEHFRCMLSYDNSELNLHTKIQTTVICLRERQTFSFYSFLASVSEQ